jgi:hypothetical protein
MYSYYSLLPIKVRLRMLIGLANVNRLLMVGTMMLLVMKVDVQVAFGEVIKKAFKNDDTKMY